LETNSSRFVVAPGTSVALVLEPTVQNGRAAVQDSMEDKFRENGWILANNATVTMTLNVVTEPERTVNYRSIGGLGSENTTVKYQPRKYQVEVRDGDKLVWSLFRDQDAPDTVFNPNRKNMNMQETVDGLMNSYDIWFQNVRIPKTISDPDKAGRSQLTENGVRN
jgi:hypothetical protein